MNSDEKIDLAVRPYDDFTKRLKLFVAKRPDLITNTLSNIFTMRLIGNKTHGDLAEIGISEFINQFMYDFSSKHVGKDLFRAKSNEEDINVTNDISGDTIPISLKAYGDGPLQLSTDKNCVMFPMLEKLGEELIDDEDAIKSVVTHTAFSSFSTINVLPLIYREKEKKCNILVFNYLALAEKTVRIEKFSEGSGRKHPVYRFYDKNGGYICEVRYGGKSANALQRGLWTNTKNALSHFDSVTNGWIDYSHNELLVELFAQALIATPKGHAIALEHLKNDIAEFYEAK